MLPSLELSGVGSILFTGVRGAMSQFTDRDLSASEGFTQDQKFSTLPEVSCGRDLSKSPNSTELPAGPGIKELPAGPIQGNELP